MRRFRILLIVAVLGFGWAMPAMAEGGVTPSWTWGGLAERLVAWADGVWRAVAGSESEAPPPGSGEGAPVDGWEGTTDLGFPDTGGEKFPALDPDG